MDNQSSESIKSDVRKNYGAVARGEKQSCCESSCCCGSDTEEQDRVNDFITTYASDPGSVAKKLGYSDEDLSALPEEANLGLGCGNPTAIASLRPGDVVLDLGSGTGMDCFLATAKVGPEGKVIGVDMTPEMIDKANENLRNSDFKNIEFRFGEIESLPVDANSVDVVISNCVLNLVPDKLKAFQEIYRVLKPGGRMAVSDIVKLRALPDAIENDPDALSACISGALPHDDYLSAITQSGLSDVTVVSKQDFGEMFFATEGPVSEKMKDIFKDGDASGYIASIKVSAVKAQSAVSDRAVTHERNSVEMDEKTKELIAIGASVAAHCQPCLTHHVNQADEMGIQDNEIKQAVAIGAMVGRGANSAMDRFIEDSLGVLEDTAFEKHKKGEDVMKKLETYDPPMCCSSGVCGPDVDPALVRFSSDLEWLKSKNVQVERFNLSQNPAAFAANGIIKKMLAEEGNDCLPVLLANGKVVSKGSYPTRDALADFLGINSDCGETEAESTSTPGSCCGGTDTCC